MENRRSVWIKRLGCLVYVVLLMVIAGFVFSPYFLDWAKVPYRGPVRNRILVLQSVHDAIQLYRASNDGRSPQSPESLLEEYGLRKEAEYLEYMDEQDLLGQYAYNPEADEDDILAVSRISFRSNLVVWIWLGGDGTVFYSLERRFGLLWPVYDDSRLHTLWPRSSRHIKETYTRFGRSSD